MPARLHPAPDKALERPRIVRPGDDNFPTTPALRTLLRDRGMIEEPDPPPATTARAGSSPAPSLKGPRFTLGKTPRGTLDVDLSRLIAYKCLIQGSAGAGKSMALRHIIEQAHPHTAIALLDPEAEFANLASHIGAPTIRAADVAADGLAIVALNARRHRLSVHLDLSDLSPDERIVRASAFLNGLLTAPKEHWPHTMLVAIDEAHLIAPHLAASGRDAEIRRLGIATLTELCARGRKRGLGPVIATQRLAKLASSVVSECHNHLLGLNVYDRDVARAGDLLGFPYQKACQLRTLPAGRFFAIGPAFAREAVAVDVAIASTPHVGATPTPMPGARMSDADARDRLDLDRLPASAVSDHRPDRRGKLALSLFLLNDLAPVAGTIVQTLKRISPNATTTTEIAAKLAIEPGIIDQAIDLLIGERLIDALPRDDCRVVRLAAALRTLIADTPIVGLS